MEDQKDQAEAEAKTSADTESDVPGLQSFGGMLRRSREKAGLSIERVAVSTRIAHPFIEALEDGEVQKLPAKVFGRGFIRNLCKVYNTDPVPYLMAFEQALEQASLSEGEEFSSRDGGRIEKKRRLRSINSLSKQFHSLPFHSRIAIDPKLILIASSLLVLLSLLAYFAIQGSWFSRIADWSFGGSETTIEQTAKTSETAVVTNSSPASPVTAKSSESTAAKTVAAKTDETPAVENTTTTMVAAPLVELVVNQQTRIIMAKDSLPSKPVMLDPGQHSLEFNQELTMVMPREADLEVYYMGKKLGSPGVDGMSRRLRFYKGKLPEIKQGE